jgi:hypothetical protein
MNKITLLLLFTLLFSIFFIQYEHGKNIKLKIDYLNKINKALNLNSEFSLNSKIITNFNHSSYSNILNDFFQKNIKLDSFTITSKKIIINQEK